jgi:hypothetical protein
MTIMSYKMEVNATGNMLKAFKNRKGNKFKLKYTNNKEMKNNMINWPKINLELSSMIHFLFIFLQNTKFYFSSIIHYKSTNYQEIN